MKAHMAQAGVLLDFCVPVDLGYAKLTDNGVSMILIAPFDATARGADVDAIRDFLAADPRYGLTENNQGGPIGVQP